MNSFIVTIVEVNQEEKAFVLNLNKDELADLLANIDEGKYSIANIVNTYSEKCDSVIPFCKVDEKLETGEKEN